MSSQSLMVESTTLRAYAALNGRTRCSLIVYGQHDLTAPLLVEDLNLADFSQRKAALGRLGRTYRAEATPLLAKLASIVAAERAKPKKPAVGNQSSVDQLEPWDNVVDGAALLEEFRRLILNYVVLPKHAPEALALWLLHTYVADVSEYTPYILVTSPVRECGKTTLLELLLNLAYRGMMSGGITAAALYRLIEANTATMLLDELDTRLQGDGGETLRGVLNTGFQRNGRVTICVGDHHEPRHFRTYCPKVLAGIGRVWDTVTSRSIPVRLNRAHRSKLATLHKIRGDRINGACLPYRRQALRWATDNREALTETDPDLPAGLGARQCDVWRSLIAIADTVGGRWPRLAREAAIHLQGAGEEESDYGLLMLEDVRQIFAEHGGDKVFSATIVRELEQRDDRPWPEYRHDRPITQRGVAALLGRFHIKSKTVRIGEETGKGYDLADLAPVFKTYLSTPQPNVTSVTKAGKVNVTNVTAKEDTLSSTGSYFREIGDGVFEFLITEADLGRRPSGRSFH